MSKTFTVAIREYNASVRTKAFIISVVLMPILMGGSIIAMKVFENQKDISDKNIALIDRTGIMADMLVRSANTRNNTAIFDKKTQKQTEPKFVVDVVTPNNDDPGKQRLELSNKVRDKTYFAFIEIGENVVYPERATEDNPESAQVRYHSENPVFGDIRGWAGSEINKIVRGQRLTEAGLEQAKVDKLTAWVNVESLGLLSVDADTGQVKQAEKSDEVAGILVPMATMMLMFMMIMMGATPLINSVLEEKMQKIAEVLLGSVSPFQMMMGKLIGTIGVSLTVMAVYAIGSVVAANEMGVADQIPYKLLPWFFAYQVAAIFMFGSMFIAIGSACNDFKEAQSLMMPVWIIVCIPMFVWINVVREPMSSFSMGLSLFPPCTPMLMLLRQATPAGIPTWQPVAGLLGCILMTTLCVFAAGRIFRVGILLQGKPPKISEIMKWALRG